MIAQLTKLRGLYAITPELDDSAALLERVTQALESAPRGWAALQYRRKRASREQRMREATALAALCRARKLPFIVNDDLALALACDADGLHLGQDDGSLAAARQALGGKLLGASCYDDLERARAALAAGADHVAFGSVFASPTKPSARRAPLALFGEARAMFRRAHAPGVPLVAIGGITLENARSVIDAGADCVAVIADLFEARDVAARAREYARLFEDVAA
jgi:thiamine-phosphate pyrophosphorylase